MATTRYVNTAAAPGGDGTTNGTAGATRAFASLSGWEGANKDLTGTGGETVYCTGTAADTTPVTILTWTTTASDYIRIYTTGADRAGTSWDTSKYRLEVTGSTALLVRADYVEVNGLQIRIASSTANDQDCIEIYGVGTSVPKFFNLLLRVCPTTYRASGIYIGDVDITAQIQNVIVYDHADHNSPYNSGIFVDGTGTTATILNCTLIGGMQAVYAYNGTVTLKNTYGSTEGQTSGTPVVFQTFGTGSITQTANASSDATATGTALDNIAKASAGFTSVTSGSENFSIGASSALKDAGTDLSLDATAPFIEDMLGNVRRYTWDIGAHEYGATTDRVLTRYVDTGSSAGGDGSSTALSGAYRAYASLNAAETARQADLTVLRYRLEILCDASGIYDTHAADTTAITVDGWTTSVDYYVRIAGARPPYRRWSDTTYRIATSGSYGIKLYEAYTQLYGLQVSTDASGDVHIPITNAETGSGLLIDSCIVIGLNATHNGSGITVSLNTVGVAPSTILNCLVYGNFGNDTLGACYDVRAETSTERVNLYNCLAYGGYRSVSPRSGGNYVNIKNGLFIGASGSTYRDLGGFNIDHCGYDNVDAGAATNSVDFTAIADGAIWSDPSNRDFELLSTSAAKDAGTSLAADSSYPFSHDFAGRTRSGSWDLGPLEYQISQWTFEGAGNGAGDTNPTTGSLGTASVGDLVVVSVATYGSITVSSISDNKGGNTYTEIGSYVLSDGAGTKIRVFYSVLAVGGAGFTVQAILSGTGGYPSVVAQRFKTPTASPLDTLGTAVRQYSDAASTGNCGTEIPALGRSNADELLITACVDSTVATVTFTAQTNLPWVIPSGGSYVSGGSNIAQVMAYALVTGGSGRRDQGRMTRDTTANNNFGIRAAAFFGQAAGGALRFILGTH